MAYSGNTQSKFRGLLCQWWINKGNDFTRVVFFQEGSIYLICKIYSFKNQKMFASQNQGNLAKSLCSQSVKYALQFANFEVRIRSLILFMIFEKNISVVILLIDQISLSGCYFVRCWAIL